MNRSDCRQYDREFLDNPGSDQLLLWGYWDREAGTQNMELGGSDTVVDFKPSLTSVMADQESICSEQELVLPDKTKVKATA